MSLKSTLAQKLIEMPLGFKLLALWRNSKAMTARRRAIGRMSVVSKKIKVVGWNRLNIGNYTVVCDDSWFILNHGHSIISIGSHVCVATRNFFTAGSRISIGDFTLTAPGCAFLGAHHDYSDPWLPQIAAPVTRDGVIEIGVNCAIGAGALILANSRVSHGSIVGAGSVVRGEFPPFSLVIGNPASVIKRYDPIRRKWVGTSEFSETMDKDLPDEASYRDMLERNFPTLRTYPGFASRSDTSA